MLLVHPYYHEFSASSGFFDNIFLYSYLLHFHFFAPIGVGVVGARRLSQLTGGHGLEHPVAFSFIVVLVDVSRCIAYQGHIVLLQFVYAAHMMV